MRDIKPLKYKELKGLSEKQLSEHHDVLYVGYIKKISEIEEKLKNVDLSSANATHSDLRELKMEETFALNGVKLHEGYFENMTPEGLGARSFRLRESSDSSETYSIVHSTEQAF